LDEARAYTLDLISSLAKKGIGPKGPSLVAGATICVPGRAMLPEAILVIDAVVIRKIDGLPELVCKRRSNNPSLKRPGIPVAPE